MQPIKLEPLTAEKKLFRPALAGESIETIWSAEDIPDRDFSRLEFPALIHFRGAWYCGFREAEIHNNHPSGRVRLIRSADGVEWQSAHVFDWDCGDVREPKFSVTPEGWLMMNTSVYFVSRQPRYVATDHKGDATLSYTPPEGRRADDVPNVFYQLEPTGTVLNLHPDDREEHVAQQTMTWLSADGATWSSAYACPTGINGWRWDVTWFNGMGYSISQWGKDTPGTLYRTRDGKSWRRLKDNFFPPHHAGEGALDFADDGTAHCLLRGGKPTNVLWGIGRAPFYQDWQWVVPTVDYGVDEGGSGPANEILGTGLGGPKLLHLRDGRWLGAGRALAPGEQDGRVTLFWIEPGSGTMTKWIELDGTSYPGMVEHNGFLYVTYISSLCHHNQWQVKLAKIALPPGAKP